MWKSGLQKGQLAGLKTLQLAEHSFPLHQVCQLSYLKCDNVRSPPPQVLQESIEIPGTGLRLVYNSQDASGYQSTLLMRLTSDPVPETLVLVHLKVVVEGTVFTKTFESDPNITYSYSWNKRNVYEQKVRSQIILSVPVLLVPSLFTLGSLKSQLLTSVSFMTCYGAENTKRVASYGDLLRPPADGTAPLRPVTIPPPPRLRESLSPPCVAQSAR